MSFVGPRPHLPMQKDIIRFRTENGASKVRPGITGLAQVSGRDELPMDIKAMYDGEYVKNITFLGDVKLLLKTVTSVLKSEGIVEGSNKKHQAKE